MNNYYLRTPQALRVYSLNVIASSLLLSQKKRPDRSSKERTQKATWIPRSPKIIDINANLVASVAKGNVNAAKMISHVSHVMTLANSIIGVSVLAMPFCFKQCGIVLATLVLILSSILSRLACHFLIKSAVMSRRRNFELLAFHAFGHMGKFLVELFIIGFLVGTCVAFFVVMGDLGPQIVGKVVDKNPEDIRTSLLIITSVFIVLPLGLLRNIDSLSSLCTATIIFYLCLVLKIVTESMPHIFAGDWYEHVYYWRPAGILQCIPIFSMALFCQTQLFEIYETIPNVSLEKMNEVVHGALNICTVVYLSVGFFGYIAFCTQPFTGNILMSFAPSLSSEMIKMGFVFSIAFSFPLVIFPCRASLNSLLFRRVYAHEPSVNYLPETRFRCLTIIIVVVSLITGILIPNIEFVLGLVGSTIGVMICLIFPAIFFISISSKNTNERLLAQVILFVGICIMILSTYANLYALEESANTKLLTATNKPSNQINGLPLNLNEDDINEIVNVPNKPDIPPDINEKIAELPDLNEVESSLKRKANDMRQEPPIPVERIVVTEKPIVMETQKPVDNMLVTFQQSNNVVKNEVVTTMEAITEKKEQLDPAKTKESLADAKRNDNLINSDAIKKEESELAADAEVANILAAERHEKLRQTLEKHKQEQLQMMEEQKEILKDLKDLEKQRIIKDIQEFQKSEGKLNAVDEKLVPQVGKNLTNNANGNNENEFLNKRREDTNDIPFDSVLPNKESGNKKEDTQIDAGKVLAKAKANKDERIKQSEISVNNSKGLPKGPILNALTKRVSHRSVSADTLTLNGNETDKIVPKAKNNSNVLSSDARSKIERAQREYSVPIALKMRNQTNANTIVVAESKSEDNVQVISRDILENHEREKRDIEETKIEETDAKVTSDTSNKISEYLTKNRTANEECSKQDKLAKENSANEAKEKLNENLTKRNSSEASLIKTNAYLSDQEFVNEVPIDPNVPLRGEYVKLKQRDLKSMDTGEDYHI